MVTLEVAVAVVAVSVLVGVPAAYALARREFPGKRAVILLFLLPILIPPITYGIPLATVLYKFHLAGTLSGVILANLVPSIPFVVLTMTPFIEQIDPRIEAAARMCGAPTSAVFARVLAPLLVPGLASVYGVRKRKDQPYEPADAGLPLPAETRWSSERYLAHVPKLFAAVRDRYGFDLHLLHDVHHRLTPIQAAQLGRRVEDPAPAELQEGFRLIRQHTTTPIAVGEVFNSIWDCQQLITGQLIDYIRAAPSHAGGITHLRRISSLAELYHVRTGPHGASDLSPVCLAAALHLDLAVPNFGIQEHMPHSRATDEVFPHSYRFDDGYLHPGEEPGLGVDIDERLAARHPYPPAYLPVARLPDGTLHSW